MANKIFIYGLVSQNDKYTTYLNKTIGMKGFGYYCEVITKDFEIFLGFHKTNKFTAVREALSNMVSNKYSD